MSNALLYLISVGIWGSTWLVITFQLGVVPPELSVAYRFALASLILIGFSILRRLPLRFSPREHLQIALQGLFLFSLNYILIYFAEVYLSSGWVAVIFSGVVIYNVIFGALFLRNLIRPQVIVGGILGILGLVIAFWPEISTLDIQSGRALGVLLAALGTVSASLGNIVSAYNQRSELPIVQTNAIGMGYGAAFMFLLALVRGVPLVFDFSAPYMLALLYLSFFGSVIAFGTYLTLLGRIGPDRAAYATILIPIIALLMSTLFEGLRWTTTALLGTALILVGNVIVLTRVRLLRRPGQPTT